MTKRYKVFMVKKKMHVEEKCMDSFAQFVQFYGPLRGEVFSLIYSVKIFLPAFPKETYSLL